MYKYRFLSILSSLNRKELKKFLAYINSPHRVVNHRVAALINGLAHSYPQFTKSPEEIFDLIYKGKPFDTVKLRRVFNLALNELEAFLLQLNVDDHDIRSEVQLLKEYRERGLIREWNAKKNEIDRKASKLVLMEGNTLIQFQKECSQRILDEGVRTVEPGFQDWADALDLDYVRNKIKLSCRMLSYEKLAKTNYEYFLLNDLLSSLNKPVFKNDLIIRLYSMIYKMQVDPEDESAFDSLLNEFQGSIESLSLEEAKEVLLFAKNYCVQKINRGNQEYFQQMFELFNLELKHELFLKDGVLSAASFKNIVSTGLNLNQIEWTRNFIEEYHQFLDKDSRNSQYAYNLARLHFDCKEFESVIPLLIKVEYSDFFTNIAAKQLLLMTYYELSEYEPMYSLMDATKVYLYKQKGESYHRELYMGFVKVLRKISNTRFGDGKRLDRLQEEVQQKRIVNSKWLLEKINGLRK